MHPKVFSNCQESIQQQKKIQLIIILQDDKTQSIHPLPSITIPIAYYNNPKPLNPNNPNQKYPKTLSIHPNLQLFP